MWATWHKKRLFSFTLVTLCDMKLGENFHRAGQTTKLSHSKH